MSQVAANAQPKDAPPPPPPPAARPRRGRWRSSPSCGGLARPAPAWHGPEQVLLPAGKVTVEDLTAAAEKRQASPHLSLLQVLVASSTIDETTAQQAVAEYFQLPFARVTAAEVDEEVFALLPLDYIKAKKVLPIRREDDDVLVALVDPADIFLIDDLKRRIRGRVQLVVAPPRATSSRSSRTSRPRQAQQVDEIIKDIAEDAVEVVDRKTEEVADLEKIAGESPVIRYVNYLISTAVSEGASDIHIEPGERHLRDPLPHRRRAVRAAGPAAAAARGHRLAPEDHGQPGHRRAPPAAGRAHPRDGPRAGTWTCASAPCPSTHGEKCVIRILDNRSILVGLESLGMAPDDAGGLPPPDRPAARHRPGHRPHRQRQDAPRCTRPCR